MAEMIPCPSCKKEISERAKVCRHCGHNTRNLLHEKTQGAARKEGHATKSGQPEIAPRRSNAAKRV
jgi:hypothetical protein